MSNKKFNLFHSNLLKIAEDEYDEYDDYSDEYSQLDAEKERRKKEAAKSALERSRPELQKYLSNEQIDTIIDTYSYFSAVGLDKMYSFLSKFINTIKEMKNNGEDYTYLANKFMQDISLAKQQEESKRGKMGIGEVSIHEVSEQNQKEMLKYIISNVIYDENGEYIGVKAGSQFIPPSEYILQHEDDLVHVLSDPYNIRLITRTRNEKIHDNFQIKFREEYAKIRDIVKNQVTEEIEDTEETSESINNRLISQPRDSYFIEYIQRYGRRPLIVEPHGEYKRSKKQLGYSAEGMAHDISEQSILFSNQVAKIGQEELEKMRKSFVSHYKNFDPFNRGENSDYTAEASDAFSEALMYGAFSQSIRAATYPPITGTKNINVYEDHGDGRIQFILSKNTIFDEYNEIFKGNSGIDLKQMLEERGIVVGPSGLDKRSYLTGYEIVANAIRSNPNNGLSGFVNEEIRDDFDNAIEWMYKKAATIAYHAIVEKKKIKETDRQPKGEEEGSRKMELSEDLANYERDITPEEREAKREVVKEFLQEKLDGAKKLADIVTKVMIERRDFKNAMILENLVNSYYNRTMAYLNSGNYKEIEDTFKITSKNIGHGRLEISSDITEYDSANFRKAITIHTETIENFVNALEKLKKDSAFARRIYKEEIERADREGGGVDFRKVALAIRNEMGITDKEPNIVDDYEVDYARYLLTSANDTISRYDVFLGNKEDQNRYEEEAIAMQKTTKEFTKADPATRQNIVNEMDNSNNKLFQRMKYSIIERTKLKVKVCNYIIAYPNKFIPIREGIKTSQKSKYIIENDITEKERKNLNEYSHIYNGIIRSSIISNMDLSLDGDSIKGIIDIIGEEIKKTGEKINEESVVRATEKVREMYKSNNPAEVVLATYDPRGRNYAKQITHLVKDIRGMPLRDGLIKYCSVLLNAIQNQNIDPLSAFIFNSITLIGGSRDVTNKTCLDYAEKTRSLNKVRTVQTKNVESISIITSIYKQAISQAMRVQRVSNSSVVKFASTDNIIYDIIQKALDKIRNVSI